jgi:predicted transcriptional regulator
LKGPLPLKEIAEILEAELILDEGWLKKEIETIFCSDLMSDILSFSNSRSLLLTGLINPQVVRTAEMVEIKSICFVHGKLPHEDTIELAKQDKIVLLSTKFSMYEACGRIYMAQKAKVNGIP